MQVVELDIADRFFCGFGVIGFFFGGVLIYLTIFLNVFSRQTRYSGKTLLTEWIDCQTVVVVGRETRSRPSHARLARSPPPPLVDLIQ